MANSRAKGVSGELEFAAFLVERGIEAKRGHQIRGGSDSPDVISGLTGYHIEVKRTNAFQFDKPGQLKLWLAQAERDAGASLTPLVAHRANRGVWWVAVQPRGRCPYFMEADGFLREWLRGLHRYSQ